jgi:hypothetical protein
MTDPFKGEYLGADLPERKQVNVRGREEHEALLRDPEKCKEHGLDVIYETMVYLKTWGGWLKDKD